MKQIVISRLRAFFIRGIEDSVKFDKKEAAEQTDNLRCLFFVQENGIPASSTARSIVVLC